MSELRYFRCPSCGGVNRLSADRLTEGPKCGRCKAALDLSGQPQHLDDAALEALIKASPTPVLVDFYADWCGPCRSLAPTLEQLGHGQAGQLVIAKIDTERNQRFASSLGVKGIPALFLFKGGKVVTQTTGAQPLGALQRWMAPYLGV